MVEIVKIKSYAYGHMAEGQRVAVRAGVASCLTRVLGPDHHARRAAEEELKTLEVTEEFGVVLAEMTASKETPVQYRQLASIILKQYIESHWNTLSEKFQEPELQEKMKEVIRELLPLCLGETHSKVRAAVAYAISSIAKWDWPRNWPNLFDQLMQFLESGEPNFVHGTMRVLSEFCLSVSDSQLSHVANSILPRLLKVIVQANVYSTHTRTRAVHIYNILSGLIFTQSMSYPETATQVLFPCLHDYLHAFVDILGSELPSNTDHGLRKEVIMTLCHLLRSFSEVLTPCIMTVVTPVWNILTQEATVYVKCVVNSQHNMAEEVYDSDGEVIGQESSIFAMFEFISVLGENPCYQALLLPILPQLLYLLIGFMQITQEQFSCWMENVNQFVDEDENEFSYSIRLSALDLVRSFTEDSELAGPCYSAIIAAINKHFQEALPSASSHWWKVHEACVLVSSLLAETVTMQEVEFDPVSFMEQVVIPDITADASPLLTGRCLWLAGKMAAFLPPTILLKLLEVVASALQPTEKPVLQVLAAKAVYYFCNELKPTEHVGLLKRWLPSYLTSLCQLAHQSPEDVVFLVVDSLQLVARMDLGMTAQCSSVIVPLGISLFLHYSHDPGISSCVEELFEALSLNPGCHASLHSHILPTSLEILGSMSTAQLPLGLVAGVFDVLVHVVRGCVVEGGAGVPYIFIQQIFPSAVQRILDSSDSAVLQNGGECVRAFVSAAVEQLASWHDSEDHSGLQYVVKVILHLLDPLIPEFSASYVGKLIIVFIRKAASALGKELKLLLRAVLSKMQNVTTSSVMQSLLLVFVRLIQTEMEEIVGFLSHVPDPSGKPALNYVISEWCASHPMFFGVYETKVSTLALCHLLSHCVATGDQRLTQLLVVGGKEGPLHTAADEIHLPVKILKLLIAQLQYHLASVPVPVDEEASFGEGLEMTLERLLVDGEEQWEIEQDPDVLDDPIMQLDIQAHLTTYLHELTEQAWYPSIKSYLTEYEQHAMHNLQNSLSNTGS